MGKRSVMICDVEVFGKSGTESRRKLNLSRTCSNVWTFITYAEECLQERETSCLSSPSLLQKTLTDHSGLPFTVFSLCCRARSKPGGTRWRTGGEVKGKLANGVGSQYSHATSEHGVSYITKADAHTSAASSRLNWRPHRFKWTRPFRGKTKSGFCACVFTFRTSYTTDFF